MTKCGGSVAIKSRRKCPKVDLRGLGRRAVLEAVLLVELSREELHAAKRVNESEQQQQAAEVDEARARRCDGIQDVLHRLPLLHNLEGSEHPDWAKDTEHGGIDGHVVGVAPARREQPTRGITTLRDWA